MRINNFDIKVKRTIRVNDEPSKFEINFNNKNTNRERSLNPYEFTNHKESFTTNFEHYLLSADFSCRRPVLYEFYRKTLREKEKRIECETIAPLIVDNRNIVDLGKIKIYEIQYLLAGESDSIESR